jgi:predicted TIM-barrel enzyme
MIIKTAMSLALSAACLATMATTPTAHAEAARRSVVVKHPPIVNSGDASASWSAQQNVIESKQYERLLETNRAFRQARMRKECGPISDPELRNSCLASFNHAEPYAGASTAPRHYRSNAGH